METYKTICTWLVTGVSLTGLGFITWATITKYLYDKGFIE
jgi:hypothetical protein